MKKSLQSLTVLSVAMLFGFNGYCYYNFSDTSKAVCIDPVICQLDSMSCALLTRDKLFVNYDDLLAGINKPYDKLPKYSDKEIKEKMKLIPSMVQLNYNRTVRDFIEFFAYKRRGFMSQCLANSQIYFPIFEAILDRKGLPMELKYLPVVESALNPAAVSRAGATGLWQLMYGTGALLGLNVNSYIDERRDPIKATEAAADYLKKLYDMYGDWQLVLAAYNSGPGCVNKAIAMAGGVKNFWVVNRYLPAETRSYVPTYIAAVYVMNYYKDFELVSAEPRRELYAVDTVQINAKVSLKHVSDVLGIPVDELQFLNPSVKTGIIPFTQNGFPMNLPINYFALYETRKEDVLMDTSQIVKNYEPVASRPAKTIWYKVKSNKETIYTVAAQYNVSAASIKAWNKMKSPYIYAGQKLKIVLPPVVVESTAYNEVFTIKIPGKVDSSALKAAEQASIDSASLTKKDSVSDTTKAAAATINTANTTNPQFQIDKSCGCIYHVVQPGDTLWSIAQRYHGVTIDKLKADNQSLMNHPLQAGEVLKIFM